MLSFGGGGAALMSDSLVFNWRMSSFSPACVFEGGKCLFSRGLGEGRAGGDTPPPAQATLTTYRIWGGYNETPW